MSIEFVGMIFPRQWSETRGVRSPDFDLPFIRHHARAHEHAGFDRVLIASGPGSADSLNRGYDPLYDTVDYGRWVIPAVREEVRRRQARFAG